MVSMQGKKYLCIIMPSWSSWLSTFIWYCGCAREVKSSILDVALFLYYIIAITVANWTPCTWKFLLDSYWIPTGLLVLDSTIPIPQKSAIPCDLGSFQQEFTRTPLGLGYKICMVISQHEICPSPSSVQQDSRSPVGVWQEQVEECKELPTELTHQIASQCFIYVFLHLLMCWFSLLQPVKRDLLVLLAEVQTHCCNNILKGEYDAFYGGEMLLLEGERCRGTSMEQKLVVLLLWVSGTSELMAW